MIKIKKRCLNCSHFPFCKDAEDIIHENNCENWVKSNVEIKERKTNDN